MKFSELMQIVGDEPVFDTGLLLAGDVNPDLVRKQLSRWTQAGKLHQLRRGVYALAAPFQKSQPHPFLVANHLMQGSYVSCQSALAYYDLIPEHVPTVTSVTTQRAAQWDLDLGRFTFRRIKAELFYGYSIKEVSAQQLTSIATAEKALLDLVYLQPGGDALTYLEALRLQNLEQLDVARLHRYVDRARSAKLSRAEENVITLIQAGVEDYETL